jgi:hypothetical protein
VTHPFGPMVEQHIARRRMIEATQSALRRDLATCTRDEGCTNSLHFPDCPSHPQNLVNVDT